MPLQHGMTLGELARLFNAENRIGADLTVIAMRGYRARCLVRRDRASLGRALAQPAVAGGHDPLSGRRR